MEDWDDEAELAPLAPLKPITERLQGLKPSQELLEFYRKKIEEYEGDQAAILARLEKYKQTYEEKHKLQWDLAQRDSEIEQLQKALSDMQVYLFQEREHVLRLYAENDRLKVQELSDRKKIQRLLHMSSTEDAGEETTYFKQPGATKIVAPHEKVKRAVLEERASKSTTRTSAKEELEVARKRLAFLEDQNETLSLTVEALKAQLQDQARLAKEETAALIEDRKVRAEEAQLKSAKDAEQLRRQTEKLKNTQQLLYDSTRDLLELKYAHRAALRESEEEKERLLHRIEELKEDIDKQHAQAMAHLKRQALQSTRVHTAREKLDKEYRDMGTNAYRPGGRGIDHDAPSPQRASGTSGTPKRGATNAAIGSDPQPTNLELEDFLTAEKPQAALQDTLAEMYREQCVQLEDEVCQLREQLEIKRSENTRTSKTHAERAKLWKQRYEALDRRRTLEAEGYRTDIDQLRKQLKGMERQLYKFAVQSGPASSSTKSMVQHARQAAVRSEKVMGELQQLKARIFNAERQVHRTHDF
ncbi:uncharacterized protein MONBRDRAFT_22803 [Monosiga brevicollis MX1]|uniref:Coiled-coil domain-containing protein 77 n=1 Tax=Monosiga brevicollis TaxID=81824 RepID=A9US47_MONBE|nr:uncharacterized protein MONBRDRAFT_22803 [Monosiga brevicollis MX1]EDQ92038.1 predicted protein [Monosiga brevicollis MX1]|eukprot:XP_001743324.1 hypothetical protein [Monosiga brevicollis MX1]